MIIREKLARAAVFATILLIAAPALATNYSESSSGDLSNSQTVPTTLALTSGSNVVTGTVNGSTDSQDWIAVTVPAGFQLSHYVNTIYSAPGGGPPADAQGFTGFDFGANFGADSPFTAGSYAGYSHFGTGATNGGVNGGVATTTVGVDLFGAQYMRNNVTGGSAEGATGFTAPLPAGSYTFLIQQLGNSIAYGFDFQVTAVPEPGSVLLVAYGAFSIGLVQLRRIRRS